MTGRSNRTHSKKNIKTLRCKKSMQLTYGYLPNWVAVYLFETFGGLASQQPGR